MKIGIVGAGAVGLYYGARLQRAGHELHYLLRRDFEYIRSNGLVVDALDGEFRLPEVNAYESPESIGPCDCVIVALKSTANRHLIPLVAPLVGAQTSLLTLQNGLGNDELLAEHFPGRPIANGLCFVCLNRTEPGVVKGFIEGTVTIGEMGNRPSDSTQNIAAAFQEAGVKIKLFDDLRLAQWRKLIWNVPFNGLAIAAGGVTTDKLLADRGIAALVKELMLEIGAGAAALGIEIPESFMDRQIEVTYPMGAYKPSSLIDYWEKSPVEVEAIWGEPLRRAQNAGVEMPKLEMLYRLLKILCVES